MHQPALCGNPMPVYPRFARYRAALRTALAATTLLAASTLALAGTTDPIPDSGEASSNDEPIVIDLDIPPELAEFLQQQEAGNQDETEAEEVVDAEKTAVAEEAGTETVTNNAENPAPIDEAATVPDAVEATTNDQPEQIQEPEPENSDLAVAVEPALADSPQVEANPFTELPFQSCFATSAATYQIEESLLVGIAIVESAMDPTAISSSDALGLMQIKWPITATHLGITERQDLFDPCINIDAGARYLRELLDDLAGFAAEPRMRLALASYRLGPNGFDPNIPLPVAAQDYIEKVTAQQRTVQAPEEGQRVLSTAGPVLPCLVQNLRQLAVITHDPAQRNAQVGQWLEARGQGCSALALIQIRNNLPVWLGTALTSERMAQVSILLEKAIATPRKEDIRSRNNRR